MAAPFNERRAHKNPPIFEWCIQLHYTLSGHQQRASQPSVLWCDDLCLSASWSTPSSPRCSTEAAQSSLIHHHFCVLCACATGLGRDLQGGWPLAAASAARPKKQQCASPDGPILAEPWPHQCAVLIIRGDTLLCDAWSRAGAMAQPGWCFVIRRCIVLHAHLPTYTRSRLQRLQ